MLNIYYIMDNQEIIKKVLEINGYEKLNPPQQDSVKHIGKSTLVTTPTASGKTTIFEIYMLDCVLNKRKKAIYLSPLKALTSEHFYETKRKFEKEFNIKIGISVGDLNQSSKYLENYDVLFLTYEKFDSIIRHQADWLSKIGLVTIDEIHEIGSDRGATLEVIITQLKRDIKDVVFLGLSATIGNSQELADWLKAKLVFSNYRPVPLEIGIYNNNKIYFNEDQIIEYENKSKSLNILPLIQETLKKNKQVIIFCNSRKSTMSLATKYSKAIEQVPEKKEKLIEVSKEVLNVLEQPTKQCLDLSNSTRNSVAFHHAGLVYKQRKLIEDNFKKKHIRIIFATPTLAAGINLPAYRVIINTIFRYTQGGMQPIPVNEFQQMAGRAGRPKYDKTGQAICVVSKESDIPKVYNSYILSGPENINSQLSRINLLRMQLLSIIMINNLKKIEEVNEYISKTFYYHIYGEVSEIQRNITDILYEFEEFGFLEIKEYKIKLTDVGKKVCYLYMDPLSANYILRDLEIKKTLNEFSDKELIFSVVNTTEMGPYLKYKQDKEDGLFEFFEKIKKRVYFEYDDIYLLQKLNHTNFINDWISEISEDKLIEEYNTTPGQIRDITQKAEWIIHCINELYKTKKVSLVLIKEFKDLETRIKYGINKELVPLARLRNIGRVRARRLYNLGFKGVSEIKNNPEKFITVIGRAGLETLKELKIEYDYKKIVSETKKENTTKNQDEKQQKNIFDF